MEAVAARRSGDRHRADPGAGGTGAERLVLFRNLRRRRRRPRPRADPRRADRAHRGHGDRAPREMGALQPGRPRHASLQSGHGLPLLGAFGVQQRDGLAHLRGVHVRAGLRPFGARPPVGVDARPRDGAADLDPRLRSGFRRPRSCALHAFEHRAFGRHDLSHHSQPAPRFTTVCRTTRRRAGSAAT